MGDWKTLFTEKQSNLTLPDSTKPRTWKELFGSYAPSDVAKIPALTPPDVPHWNEVIEPSQKRAEVADDAGEFIIGIAGRFDKGMASLFNKADYLQTSLGDAVNQILIGKEGANDIKKFREKYGADLSGAPGVTSVNSIRPFKAVSNAIDFCAAPAKELPDTFWGNFAGGMADIGPQMIAAYVAPEIKTGQMLAKWGVPVLSKFGLALGVQGLAGGMQNAEQGTAVQKLTTPIISGIEQYMTGWMYDAMGAISSKLGSKLVNRFVPEIKTASQAHTARLIGSLGTTVFNASLFGGYGTLSEFLETGKTSWKTLETNLAIGMGLGGREVMKGLGAKVINTFIAADMPTIKRAAESDVSADELAIHAQESARSIENKTTSDHEGAGTATVLSTNIAFVKTAVEEIKENPAEFTKIIEDSNLPSEVKDYTIKKIKQVFEETDPGMVATKPYTDKIKELDDNIKFTKENVPIGLQETRIQSMAEKRERLFSKVQKIDKESRPVSDEKKTEDLKQARILEDRAAQIYPQFKEQGKAIAEEVGGRFESRLKSVESTTGKAARENIEVPEMKDILGGAIIVSDLKEFKAVSKRLKREGYSISNKRIPNKETGRLGVIATKMEDGIGKEIQLHTEGTWEAQKKAEGIWGKEIPPQDMVDVETDRANYKPEEQIKAHEEFGGSTFTVGGQNLAGKEGKAAVSVFPDRTEIIKPASKETNEQSAFPEDYTPEVQKRKSGKDKVSVTDKDGNEISSITFKTTTLFGDKYWVVQQAATETEHQGKGFSTNVYKYAMENLPEGYKGIISPEESRLNKTQIPKIHEKLKKIYDTETQENGDIIFRPKKKGGLTPEIIDDFYKKNKDIFEKDPGVFSIGTWKNENGATELDIVATPDTERAIELAKKYNQKSVYAFDKGEISTGGTGSGEEFKKVPIETRIADATETTRTRYEAAMEESRRLYKEAYTGIEDIDLEGSPAKTPLEKRMKALEIPIAQQKELKKAWTEGKRKFMDTIKEANKNIKDEFKAFIKDLPLTELGIPLRKAMLNKVNNIDFTKPKSLENAITYFDKIIDNATERLNFVRAEKVLSRLDERGSKEFLEKKNKKGMLVNKLGPTGLDLYEELKGIHKDMTEGDYNEGQKNIMEINARLDAESRAATPEEMGGIARENFKGLLNTSNKASVDDMEGALRDLNEIIRNGKTMAAAKRIMMKAPRIEFRQTVFDEMNGKEGKPVNLDELESSNIKHKPLEHFWSWYFTSSWESLMEAFSKFSKTDPYKSELSKAMTGVVRAATVNEKRGRAERYAEVIDNFKKIHEATSKSQMRKLAHENTNVFHKIKYKSIFGAEKEIDFTVNEAGKVWQELQDPSLEGSASSPSRMHDPYMKDGELTDLGQKVIDLLSPRDKEWAAWQMDFYKRYHPRINEVYKSRRGVDMPMNEFYSPIFVADKMGEGYDTEDIFAHQTLTNTAENAHMITRLNHNKKLRKMDMDKVLTNYIDKMEYYVNWSDAMDLMNEVFVRDGNIRKAIDQNFGKMALDMVDNRIKDFANAPSDRHKLIKWLNNFIGNYTIASLAIKPKIGFNQFTSLLAYTEGIPVFDYAKNNPFNDWKGTKEAWKAMSESDFFKERYQTQSWDWTTIEAMKKDADALNSQGGFNKFKNSTMFITKYADMGTVMLGGVPVYKHFYNEVLRETGNERLAKQVALDNWTRLTASTQQSGEKMDLSAVQRDPVLKMLTMYKTQPMQYQRKISAALRNSWYGRGGKAYNPFSFNGKSLLLYHAVLPMMFQFVVNGFKVDWKDELQAGILGNINELFVIGDIMDAMMNTVRGLPFDYQMTPLESTGRSFQKMAQSWSQANIIDWIIGKEDEISTDDLLKGFNEGLKIAGDVTGIPYRYGATVEKSIEDIISGETKKPVRRIMGWSEKSMEDENEVYFKDPEKKKELEKYLNDTKHPTLNNILEMNKKPLPSTVKKSTSTTNKKPLPGK
jgi:hypothetical protein